MDIKKYIAKRKLLGAKECNVLKYREMEKSGKKVEAYVYGTEAIYGVEVTPKRIVYFICESDKELDIDTFVDIKEYNNKLYCISIEQKTKEENLYISSLLFVFSNGNMIALNNYGNLHISYALTDKYGVCINIDKVIIENGIKRILIDEDLIKYECTLMGLGMSEKLEKYETIAIMRTGSCKIRKEKILKRLQKIDFEGIKEAEVYGWSK